MNDLNLKNRRWLWSIMILLLIVSLPGLSDRWKVEWQNNQYEMILPFNEIQDLTKDFGKDKITLAQALSSLKEAGLDTVSFEPDTLSELENQHVISILSQQNIKDLTLFNDEQLPLIKEKGVYITVPEDSYYQKQILNNLKNKKVKINNTIVYFIPDPKGDIRSTPIGYNQEAIQMVKDYGLNFVLRLKNSTFNVNKKMIDEVLKLDDEHLTSVLFSGSDVIGSPKPQEIKKWAKQLNDAGLSFYAIEFSDQKGMQTIAKETDYSIIRLHSLNIDKKTFHEKVDRATRAVKERNIRALFLHLDNGSSKESLKSATKYISQVKKEMPSLFVAGEAKPFDDISVSKWLVAVVLLSGVIFTALAAMEIMNKKIGALAAIFMGLVAVFYLLTSKLVFLQVFALIIAVITPIFAVLFKRERSGFKGITIHYLQAVAISIIGIIIVLGLLNGNEFLTKMEVFKGVKLVYIVPILFVTVYAFWGQILTILKSQVKYWHIALILVIAAVGYYYIGRTGNSGSVSELELTIRQKLEEAFYVRPRTKEFLIGFPFYMLALYVMSFNKKWGKFILIPGVIGFLSIMNTFTHLHIPLYISTLRTFYSIVLGFIVGYLFIIVFKFGYRYISRMVKARWP
ncbi:hypothetical protein AC625_22320 [Peribacillus loiseleuriae]|uniref:Uncharacterized protein n=1 Tax=Peribacillus loiseleuriae TaxID=1679170 RepID=A0A0K9H0J5_9BACI|nr:hypothetical protein AC625_22320 [Peribacillus loiseleuriae]